MVIMMRSWTWKTAFALALVAGLAWLNPPPESHVFSHSTTRLVDGQWLIEARQDRRYNNYLLCSTMLSTRPLSNDQVVKTRTLGVWGTVYLVEVEDWNDWIKNPNRSPVPLRLTRRR
jgi:hypothetical protein